MKLSNFFDQLVIQYKNAESSVEFCTRPNIYRGRQHDISSIAEDMFAALLSDILTPQFPGIKLHFRVDFPMTPGTGSRMFPDIAIISDDKTPVLVGYLDIKTDLGYKRNYYEAFDSIKTHVERLRTVADTGTTTSEAIPRKVIISKTIKWRTVVISDCNLSPSSLLQHNKDCAIEYENYFKLYFLSGRSHPNEKRRERINTYDELPFNELIEDLKLEITSALPLVKALEIQTK